MTCQHRELHLRLDDANKLRRYAQSAASKNHTLEDALEETKARSKHQERNAKEGIERITGVEKKGDEVKEEARIARPAIVATSDMKAQVEDELARVQEALAVVEEDRHKAGAEVASLEVERTSLLLEVGAT